MKLEKYVYNFDDYIVRIEIDDGIVKSFYSAKEPREKLYEWKKVASEVIEKAIDGNEGIEIKTTWFPLGRKYANYQWLSLEFEPLEQNIWLVTQWRGCNGWAWADIGLTGSKEDGSIYTKVENIREFMKEFIRDINIERDYMDLFDLLECKTDYNISVWLNSLLNLSGKRNKGDLVLITMLDESCLLDKSVELSEEEKKEVLKELESEVDDVTDEIREKINNTKTVKDLLEVLEEYYSLNFL